MEIWLIGLLVAAAGIVFFAAALFGSVLAVPNGWSDFELEMYGSRLRKIAYRYLPGIVMPTIVIFVAGLLVAAIGGILHFI